MELLRLEGVTKRYISGAEVLTILDGIDLSIPAGSVTVFTGESGSGKSTLLNIVGALDSPDAGKILVDGIQVDQLAEIGINRYRAETIGFVFQFHYLLEGFTALENTMLPAFMRGLSMGEAREKARALLFRVGLEKRLDHTPSMLSGGERQRVALARALINDPKLLLADEPTGNLDEGNTGRVKELLFSLVRDMGKTLLLVTHETALIPEGDRAYRLHAGKLETL
ncbi:ABC transporter ATP-binding protein [Marispirochaeta sp.]|jgi:lipoprotein-releasing system ATP-binding protein|uniref:ABC transporter ATP-binding protein n=1 Tax=Marispirochaeta sp. TaxID=2038653 RepID=UPI0029C6DBB8|nr:ABC transporter ATP-binding protein [Marispirochaeta sp.]